MGACRENMNIFSCLKRQPWKNNKRDWKGFWRIIKSFDKIAFEDSFMPIVCKIFGHKPYRPDPQFEPDEFACLRCHRYITEPTRKSKSVVR